MLPISDSDNIRRSRPFTNLSLIALCAAVFAYELVIGERGLLVFTYQFGLIPAELGRGADFSSLVTRVGAINIASPIPNWATVITSMFIHGGWLHFLGNMLFLWVFGDNIEDRFGHLKYLLFYLAAGAAAAWLQIMVNTVAQVPMIGASGAIAGVLGAYLVFFPLNRIKTLVTLFFFITFVRIPALVLLGFWFLLQSFEGVGSLGPSVPTGGTAYFAHIGGFIAGVIVAALYRIATHGRSRPMGSEPVNYWRGRRV